MASADLSTIQLDGLGDKLNYEPGNVLEKSEFYALGTGGVHTLGGLYRITTSGNDPGVNRAFDVSAQIRVGESVNNAAAVAVAFPFTGRFVVDRFEPYDSTLTEPIAFTLSVTVGTTGDSSRAAGRTVWPDPPSIGFTTNGTGAVTVRITPVNQTTGAAPAGGLTGVDLWGHFEFDGIDAYEWWANRFQINDFD